MSTRPCAEQHGSPSLKVQGGKTAFQQVPYQGRGHCRMWGGRGIILFW